jgi:hypothetical protein
MRNGGAFVQDWHFCLFKQVPDYIRTTLLLNTCSVDVNVALAELSDFRHLCERNQVEANSGQKWEVKFSRLPNSVVVFT